MAQQTNISNSDLRTRFGSHTSENSKNLQGMIQGKFFELAETLNDFIPDGRAKSISMTELENSAMWARKALDADPR